MKRIFNVNNTDLIQKLEGLLEAGELHHGVGDLSAPQWHQPLVEGSVTFILDHLGPRLTECVCKTRHSLDSDLVCYTISMISTCSNIHHINFIQCVIPSNLIIIGHWDKGKIGTLYVE